ncbi:MAG: hypothetical protein KIH63_004575 [Candidatus Saccharibacteria bacterium]|nr:hypothetical protein [Candidatus Saccharibacteria bacterium]
MISNCPACHGTKKTRQLGNIIADCKNCKGTGVLTLTEIVKPAVVENVVLVPDEVSSIRAAKGKANAKKDSKATG